MDQHNIPAQRSYSPDVRGQLLLRQGQNPAVGAGDVAARGGGWAADLQVEGVHWQAAAHRGHLAAGQTR